MGFEGKAALVTGSSKGLGRAIALRLAERGAGIFTGVADDDPYKKALPDTVPLGRLATAVDVAGVAEFLASEESFFITGEEILMNGGSSN